MAMDGPPMSVKAEPFPHLIEESFEESTFLWTRWEADLVSISRNLSEVWTWTEDRLAGALDGVRLAPEASLERFTQTALVAGQSAELTICGHVLADSAAANARQLLGDALRNAKGPALKSLLRGVETAHLDGRFAAAAGEHRLLLDGGGNAEALGQAGEIDAGGAALRRVGVGDRTGRDERLPERDRGRNVGRRRASACAPFRDRVSHVQARRRKRSTGP